MNLAEMARWTVVRLRWDYAQPDRADEYAAILGKARAEGYALIPLGRFVEDLRSGRVPERCLILRHDVDISSPEGNEEFFRVEREMGGRATYYFRLSTARAHLDLIRRLRESGFEVGYHFEEGATVAKRHRLRRRDEVFSRREEVVSEFRDNCRRIHETWGPEFDSASAHGDWINRRLGFINNELIDRELLRECGIRFEAYDGEIRSAVDVYVSDAASPPQVWAGGFSPLDAIAQGKRRIYMLTHERRWTSGRLAKASSDAIRVWETARFSLGVRSKGV